MEDTKTIGYGKVKKARPFRDVKTILSIEM
jgi:hypothetical protein